MVAICAGNNFAVRLKTNGTAVVIGNDSSGQCKVTGWTEIMIP
ncbi:MAG: hypothetical protein ACI39R_03145 [Lachnospiraceae bacterium]